MWEFQLEVLRQLYGARIHMSRPGLWELNGPQVNSPRSDPYGVWLHGSGATPEEAVKDLYVQIKANAKKLCGRCADGAIPKLLSELLAEEEKS